jgi:lysozyme
MNALDLIKSDEGLRLKMYKCTANKWTIGYGRNIEDRGISADEADYLFKNDIRLVRETLQDKILNFPLLSEVRQAVLLNMCYQLGWPRLSKFQNFLGALEFGQYDKAAGEMINSAWATQTPVRVLRLAQMMRTNRWPVVDDKELEVV